MKRESQIDPATARHVSPLYRRLVVLRLILPLAALAAVLAHQALAYFLAPPAAPFSYVANLVFYGLLGPALLWWALGALVRRVRERDESEERLHWLHSVNEAAAAAPDSTAVVDLALRLPGEVLAPLGVSLVQREQADGPWVLAGARGLDGEAQAALEAGLMLAGAGLRCGRCSAWVAAVQHDCPLLSSVRGHLATESVVCLPLSTERPPLALLNVYLPGREPLPAPDRRLLESMAAGLAVALDHARLRERELETLHQVQYTIRRPHGLPATLGRALAEVAEAQRAESAAVFLATWQGGEPALTPVANWCDRLPDAALAGLAQRAVQERRWVMANGSELRLPAIAVPLLVEDTAAGALALSAQRAFTTPQITLLSVAAGMMALAVRNSQLCGELEIEAVRAERSRVARGVHDGLAQSLGFLNFKVQQADRHLAREEWDALRRSLAELRGVVQELYAEARSTIYDLRWPAEVGLDLAERLRRYTAALSERTGLDISLEVEGQTQLSAREETHLFHVAQEALTNVRKHAQARHTLVRLEARPEAVLLEVADDGVGLPAAALAAEAAGAGRVGLRILRERAEAIGAQVSIESAPGEGTRLRVSLPTTAPQPNGTA